MSESSPAQYGGAIGDAWDPCGPQWMGDQLGDFVGEVWFAL